MGTWARYLEICHGHIVVNADFDHVQEVVIEEAAEHNVVWPLLVVRSQQEQAAARSTPSVAQCGSGRVRMRPREAKARARGWDTDQSFLLEKNSSELASSNGRMLLFRWKRVASGFLRAY